MTQSANVKAANATLDFSNLAASKATLPGVARTSKLDSAPAVLAAVKDSNSSGEARQFTVPKASAKELVYLIRAAARSIDRGVRIVEQDQPGNKVAVIFQAKDKKVKRTKEEREAAEKAAAERKAAREAKAKSAK